jgi:transaldolase (EC 2.2.1.2)
VFLSGELGYVSRLVGRLDQIGRMGIGLIEDIAKVFCIHESKTQILAASIRSAASVAQSFKAGAHIGAIRPKVFDNL